MCVNPYIAKTKDGKSIPVPCGKCLDCRQQYQNEWIFRLTQECKRTNFPCFVTLTYNDDNLPVDVDDSSGELLGVLVKRHVQLFMKRLRKNGGDYLKDCRYYAIGEYGSKFNRPHYHLILIAPHVPNVEYVRQLVDKCWDYGFTKTKFATSGSFHYVCKYMNKLDERFHLVKPFRLYSRSIGLNFLTDRMIDYYLTTFSRTCISGSCRIGLPRYYKRKLDLLSESRPMLKRSGLCYSDLLDDVQPLPGTKYFYLKDFTENFDYYYKQATCYLTAHMDDFNEDFLANVIHPTRQQVWRHYVNTHHAVQNLILQDSRLLKNCLIRNKLIGRVPTSMDALVTNDIILKE